MFKRVFFITLLVLGSAAFTTRPSSGARREGAETPRSCQTQRHPHHVRDVRMAAVEVRATDSCGFSYIDREVELMGRYDLADEFKLVSFDREGRMVEHNLRDLKRGLKGTLVYCDRCKAALGFRIEE